MVLEGVWVGVGMEGERYIAIDLATDIAIDLAIHLALDIAIDVAIDIATDSVINIAIEVSIWSSMTFQLFFDVLAYSEQCMRRSTHPAHLILVLIRPRDGDQHEGTTESVCLSAQRNTRGTTKGPLRGW